MAVYVFCYGVGMLFASSAHSYLSGICLMAAAVYLYFADYLRTKNPLHLRALFNAFWVGGQGISCLKLSRLQGPWSPMTWACFFAATVGVWGSFEVLGRWKRDDGKMRKAEGREPESRVSDGTSRRYAGYARGINLGLLLLTAVSLGAFLIEAAVLGYVPFFVRGVPHAYSYFHISGLHYFTVSCVLVPSMAVVLYFADWEREGAGGDFPCEKKFFAVWLRKRAEAVLAAGISLVIPILCVSRFQLVFAAILSVLTFMIVSGQRKLRYLAAAGVALIPFYVILTVARSHDVAYLNGIFEMKNSNTPIFITQPYMYIANNYDNFNCLVEQLPRHTLGVKSLFPLWALTGLKFLKPELVSYPIFTTKEELTTVTLFYDSYYDFGILGVFCFAVILGAFAFWIMEKQKSGKNPAWQLVYSQAALYFMLSFFTTWYSNPTTWFYLAATFGFAVFIELMKKFDKGEVLWYQKE